MRSGVNLYKNTMSDLRSCGGQSLESYCVHPGISPLVPLLSEEVQRANGKQKAPDILRGFITI